MASGLFSSIHSLSTKLLEAIRGTPSTSHHHDAPDTNQHKSVREYLEKLSRMLTRIQAIQLDAEEREIHDKSVWLWLAELRGVAYQAEDVLDDLYYEVLRSIADRGDAAIEAYHRNTGTKRKFAEMYTSSSIASDPLIITKASIPYDIAEKIKSITERFEEISNARRDLHLREEDGTRLVMGPQIRPPTSSHVDERATFGRKEEKKKIISLLDPSNGPDFMVLPIVGMGGFGKTTLAQLVFNDSMIHGLFNKRCWVSVLEDFDLVRITKAIVDSLSEKRENPCEFSELNILQDVLKEKIRGHGLFLVLDDVWNEKRNLWECFRVGLLGAKFVRILTTTRNTSVAKIMQTTSPFQLSSLPEENCWSLFKHFAFSSRERSENANLHEIGRGIAKKCKGSPLAVKALGGILRYEMDEVKWREILESDISEIDETGEVMPALRLSYQKLPQQLKRCFLYLSMFPKGSPFEKDMVVRLWMAQGYINGNGRKLKTLEEIGSEYFVELQGRSLIDCRFYTGYFLHDLIHDLARSISEEAYQPNLENDQELNGPCKVYHLYFTNQNELLGGPLVPNDYCSIRTFVSGYSMQNSDLTILYDFSCVRALHLSYSLVPNTLGTLKHLRYLSINDDSIESLPEYLCRLYHLQTLDMYCDNILELPENIKTLINLRFLRLYSDKIKGLPESLSLLHNLDTLSIEGCSVLKKVPNSIEQLTNLRVLKLPKYSICNLPSGIGKLTNLITLSGKFKVMGSDMTPVLGELRDMNRLSGLMSISGLKNVGNIEYSRNANLVSKPNLSKLILNFEGDCFGCKRFLKNQYEDPFFYIVLSSSTNENNENDEKIQEGVLDSLQPHGNLKELVILNYGGRGVPPWLFDPSYKSKLTTLTLHLKRELTFLPSLLGQLLHLKCLKIFGSGGTEILFTNDSSKEPSGVSFSSHEEHSFNNILNLGNWQAGDEPCLKKLIIKKCPKLWKVTIPHKVEVLEVNVCGCHEIKSSSHSELKRLSLYGCPNLLMLSAIPIKLKQLDIKDCGFQEINLSSLSNLQNILIFNCRELVSIYYKIGDLPFLKSISLYGCPKLLIFSAILEEMKQIDKRNSGFQFEIQNVSISDYREFIPSSPGRVSLSNCPKLRIFSAIPAVELDTLEIIDCGIREIILPSRCQLLEIHNCPELISVHWSAEYSSSLPLVKIVNCPQLELLKFPKEVEELQIKSCGTRDIFFSSQSMVRTVHINGCRKLSSVHWMDGDVPYLKEISFEGCSELISLQFLQGDLPLLEKFAIKSCPQFHELLTIPYQLKELKIVDCCFPEIQLLPQSKLRRLIISECENLTAIKGLQALFPTGDVSHPMMEMVEIRNCPKMDFGTHRSGHSGSRYIGAIV